MKKRYVTILVLAMGAIVLLFGPLPCWAEEKEEESVWQEDEPRGRGGVFRRFELTDEVIERMMSRLAESDPAKAKELAKLREKDPEKFKAELREVMRERFGQRWGEQGKGGGRYGPEQGMEFGGRGGRGEAGAGRTRGKAAMYRRRGPGFDEWLAEIYPEEAKKLAELKEKNPALHRGRYAICRRRLERIYEASKENPELAKILTEDLELKEQRDELLKYMEKLMMLCSDDSGLEPATKKEYEEKIEITKESLRVVLTKRFDLIVRRKEIEYESLLKKLQKLQERVKQSEAQVAKWKEAEFKKTSVKGRVEELVGKAEKFRWE